MPPRNSRYIPLSAQGPSYFSPNIRAMNSADFTLS